MIPVLPSFLFGFSVCNYMLLENPTDSSFAAIAATAVLTAFSAAIQLAIESEKK